MPPIVPYEFHSPAIARAAPPRSTRSRCRLEAPAKPCRPAPVPRPTTRHRPRGRPPPPPCSSSPAFGAGFEGKRRAPHGGPWAGGTASHPQPPPPSRRAGADRSPGTASPRSHRAIAGVISGIRGLQGCVRAVHRHPQISQGGCAPRPTFPSRFPRARPAIPRGAQGGSSHGRVRGGGRGTEGLGWRVGPGRLRGAEMRGIEMTGGGGGEGAGGAGRGGARGRGRAEAGGRDRPRPPGGTGSARARTRADSLGGVAERTGRARAGKGARRAGGWAGRSAAVLLALLALLGAMASVAAQQVTDAGAVGSVTSRPNQVVTTTKTTSRTTTTTTTTTVQAVDTTDIVKSDPTTAPPPPPTTSGTTSPPPPPPPPTTTTAPAPPPPPPTTTTTTTTKAPASPTAPPTTATTEAAQTTPAPGTTAAPTTAGPPTTSDATTTTTTTTATPSEPPPTTSPTTNGIVTTPAPETTTVTIITTTVPPPPPTTASPTPPSPTTTTRFPATTERTTMSASPTPPAPPTPKTTSTRTVPVATTAFTVQAETTRTTTSTTSTTTSTTTTSSTTSSSPTTTSSPSPTPTPEPEPDPEPIVVVVSSTTFTSYRPSRTRIPGIVYTDSPVSAFEAQGRAAGGISSGAVVGIALGVTAATVAVVVGVLWWSKGRKRARDAEVGGGLEPEGGDAPEMAMALAQGGEPRAPSSAGTAASPPPGFPEDWEAEAAKGAAAAVGIVRLAPASEGSATAASPAVAPQAALLAAPASLLAVPDAASVVESHDAFSFVETLPELLGPPAPVHEGPPPTNVKERTAAKRLAIAAARAHLYTSPHQADAASVLSAPRSYAPSVATSAAPDRAASPLPTVDGYLAADRRLGGLTADDASSIAPGAPFVNRRLPSTLSASTLQSTVVRALNYPTVPPAAATPAPPDPSPVPPASPTASSAGSPGSRMKGPRPLEPPSPTRGSDGEGEGRSRSPSPADSDRSQDSQVPLLAASAAAAADRGLADHPALPSAPVHPPNTFHVEVGRPFNVSLSLPPGEHRAALADGRPLPAWLSLEGGMLGGTPYFLAAPLDVVVLEGRERIRELRIVLVEGDGGESVFEGRSLWAESIQ